MEKEMCNFVRCSINFSVMSKKLFPLKRRKRWRMSLQITHLFFQLLINLVVFSVIFQLSIDSTLIYCVLDL